MAQIPDAKRLQQLARKFLQGTISDAEQQELDHWFLSQDELRGDKRPIDFSEDEHRNLIFARIKGEIQKNPPQKIRTLWPRIAAAASILILLSAGGYFLFHKKLPTNQIAQNQIHEIKPGGNKAILTLANGHAISLTDAKNGKVAAQGNTIVNKTAAGVIQYAATENTAVEKTVEPLYNTLTTPRGGRFEGLLPDGTHVILDAASSIKYQVNVTGKDRLVWITGQVHFNVTYNTSRPFYVNVKGQVMKDLGTAFNINAYDDEPVVRVTLEEGSLSVSKGNQSAVLTPGQQAITKTFNDLIKVQPVNIYDVLAWTKGQTSFHDENIQEIMRQVSRWYDVDVLYDGQIPTRLFDGSISRDANLSDLLKVLEFNNIHFTVNGKTITVRP
jgi:transmembrane sensor